jgi:hypothetical protein
MEAKIGKLRVAAICLNDGKIKSASRKLWLALITC